MAELKRVTLAVLGETYTLKTDQDEAYVRELAAEMELKVRQLKQRSPSLTTTKAMALFAMDALDERDQWRRKYEKLLAELEILK